MSNFPQWLLKRLSLYYRPSEARFVFPAGEGWNRYRTKQEETSIRNIAVDPSKMAEMNRMRRMGQR